MATTELDALLARMPEIAAAVKQFPSESIQAEVFRVLIRAFGVLGEDDDDDVAEDVADFDGANPVKKTAVKKAASKKTTSKKTAGSKPKLTFSIDKDLDLVKGGKPPFQAFRESRSPKSDVEKCLVSVYWLSRLRTPPKPATVEQVYSCFKAAAWRVPADLRNTLAQAGTKGWLDSKKADDLKVTVPGENYIEHEMPARAKGGG